MSELTALSESGLNSDLPGNVDVATRHWCVTPLENLQAQPGYPRCAVDEVIAAGCFVGVVLAVAEDGQADVLDLRSGTTLRRQDLSFAALAAIPAPAAGIVARVPEDWHRQESPWQVDASNCQGFLPLKESASAHLPIWTLLDSEWTDAATLVEILELLDVSPGLRSTPAQQAAGAELLRGFHAGNRPFPRELRMVLARVAIDSDRLADTAEEFGVEPGSLRTWVARARRSLR